MANRDSTSNEPASTIAQPPIHQNFSWSNRGVGSGPDERFADQVRNVARGGLAVANIIRKEYIRDDSGQPRLLPGDDLDGLVGLMVVAFELMDEAAEDHIDRLEKLASKGAK